MPDRYPGRVEACNQRVAVGRVDRLRFRVPLIFGLLLADAAGAAFSIMTTALASASTDRSPSAARYQWLLQLSMPKSSRRTGAAAEASLPVFCRGLQRFLPGHLVAVEGGGDFGACLVVQRASR